MRWPGMYVAAVLLCGCAEASWSGCGAPVISGATALCSSSRRAVAPVAAEKGSDEIDGWGGSTDANTMFAAWDGRDEEGISPEGMLPPGEDLIEADLRRVFTLESTDGTLDSAGEFNELELMYKLRKELGDADFRRIFEDPRVKGPSM